MQAFNPFQQMNTQIKVKLGCSTSALNLTPIARAPPAPGCTSRGRERSSSRANTMFGGKLNLAPRVSTRATVSDD